MGFKDLIKTTVAAAMSFSMAACADPETGKAPLPQRHVTVTPDGAWAVSKDRGESYRSVGDEQIRRNHLIGGFKVDGESGNFPLVTDNTKVVPSQRAMPTGFNK